jgi:hypothetical protein
MGMLELELRDGGWFITKVEIARQQRLAREREGR